ncbi:sulfide:quinone oxidoreductase, mitochondrial [Neocloeon triangulifer]|uniref:sulfide:quinone oxidoreductase, mitochondrial n=1 Tax=Neocloeon triangulifer TaxID=2078957 RepID=UPI00286ECF4A|nr:sulfide:quinone oxidoreductase, mitochondrial [Neocloeon triangulifer]
MRCLDRPVLRIIKVNKFKVSSEANFATSGQSRQDIKCDLLVVGGGAGGCSMAAKFASKLGKNKVVIVEPKDVHYYQPMWTLVGGGMKTLADSGRAMASVLPSDAHWVKDQVAEFSPKTNSVRTKGGDSIQYNFMLVAVGLKLDFHKIKGLEDALAKDPRVCSNYSPLYVDKTFKALQNFQGGPALFTFPNTPIKCAGAPQKVMYIFEEYLRKHGKRDAADIKYYTSLGVIFGVKKYAAVLLELCKKRGIEVTFRHNLIEVNSSASEATFENLDKPGGTLTQKYSFLHATPAMSTPEVLSKCADLVDKAGYLEVSKTNLQHVRFPNIFGIGDCTNAPTSKTAAAVAGQCGVVKKHLAAVMAGKPLPSVAYDGYTSCPLVTGYSSCILAEFDYDGQPLETLPFDQGKERWSTFFMKKTIMPQLYWHAMLNGYWEGPKLFRKAFHLGMGK